MNPVDNKWPFLQLLEISETNCFGSKLLTLIHESHKITLNCQINEVFKNQFPFFAKRKDIHMYEICAWSGKKFCKHPWMAFYGCFWKIIIFKKNEAKTKYFIL